MKKLFDSQLVVLVALFVTVDAKIRPANILAAIRAAG